MTAKAIRVMLYALLAVALVAALGAVVWFGALNREPPPATADTPTPTPGWPTLVFRLHASGLSRPVHVTHAGDGSGRLFIVEKAGRIRILRGGALIDAPFLDIRDRVGSGGSEQGLLSVAFPPGYADKGYFYVDYTDAQGDTVVARFHLSSDPDVADAASEEVILTIEQPFANHNGGQLAFGPDGYLYIGMGDGGSAGDPQRNGQNTAVLLGKLLRIDVESGVHPYAIPPTNPYTNTAGYRGEIWAYGLRNPWRFSFDSDTGDLYIADVGQREWEEVDFQPASSGGGENYGWNIMEGSHCYASAACDQAGLVLPVTEYSHAEGDCSITGGFVYRGAAYPAMRGIYFYGDYCTGRIWGLRQTNGAWESRLLADTPYSITTFGADEDGDLYVAAYTSGEIYQIADTSLASVRFPAFSVSRQAQCSR